MFAPRSALDACKSFFIQEGVNIDVLRLPTTIAAFFDFYRDERAEGCEPHDDADMLLFEWGTFDWGDGEHFGLSLARQLIYGDDDDDIWQLKLTYAFQPTDAFRALGDGNRWCAVPDDLPEFRDGVAESAAYRMAADHAEIGIVSIGYYRAG
ncbi:MAG: hypothetical protein GKS00_29055 [Alphaproteobacteria bacterium]|nr:hypothetical protein [Alphaproteobacteria bacterium]